MQRKLLFFIKHWKFWVKIFLVKNENQFRLHNFLGENWSETQIFNTLKDTFYPHTTIFSNLCGRFLQCQA